MKQGNESPAPGKSRRLAALDFTKGALVLFMVLYHWFNYFYGPQSDLYKYLRFLTPSFIFITGFLVSNMYLPRYRSGDSQIPKRIAVRALKLLALFLALNVAISLLISQSYNGKIAFQTFTLHNLVSVYVTGNTVIVGQGKAVAFYILLPISYLLLLSSALLRLSKHYRYTFHVVTLLYVVASFTLNAMGIESANLELITIGLLGVMAGHVSIDKIGAFVSHWHLLVVAYLCYTVVITFTSVGYTLQLISVVLNLMLFYLIGTTVGEKRGMSSQIVLLGKYSLFGYIIQIAILQVLYRAARHVGSGAGISGVALVGAVILTMVSVVILDQARAKQPPVDSLYRAVFS